jgi:cytochrome c oxidase subunit 2
VTRWTLLIVAIVCFGLAVVVAFAGMFMVGRRAGIYGTPSSGPPGMTMPYGAPGGPGRAWREQMRARAEVKYASNGQRIYFTGVDAAGNEIPFAAGPPWLAMHGGSCVDCHAEDGRGGIAVIPGGGVSPDIRYDVLTGKERPSIEGDTEHEHTPHTDATIKRAITDGIDADGQALDLTMPRYRMSEKDLNDVIDYLKQLDRRR